MTRFLPAFGAAVLVSLFAAVSAFAQPTPFAIPTDVPIHGRTAIVTSSGGSNPPYTGLNINALTGATAFYSAGYTGSTAIVANIEGGLTWNGHESLSQGQVTQYLSGPGALGEGNPANNFDKHATWTGAVIAGRPTAGGGEYQRGVAYGATLWSGGIATVWTGSSSFDASYQSFYQPFVTATRNGIGGQTADVVNGSWGGFSGNESSASRDPEGFGLDALARDTRKVFVFSAGNSGSGADTVARPATAYNVISVGALDGPDGAIPYDVLAGFSSRGPNYAFNPTLNNGDGDYVANARIRVDIVAPGTGLTLALYGGATGGNTGGSETPGSNLYYGGLAGTSFAAPIVASGAALLVDAGRQLSLPNSADGRIVKVVLMNSADKIPGWNNAQAPVNGAITTTQALDPGTGAGRLNLAAALPYYASANSTRDVPGTATGNLGTVQPRGYDFGQANLGTSNSYVIAGGALPANGSLKVTLNWFINRGIDSFDNPTALDENALANLDLEVWLLSDGSFTTLYAHSISIYNNTEHLYLTDLPAGEYGIRVVYDENVWAFNGENSEFYGLAWEYTPVPEPTWMLAAAFGSMVVVWRRSMRRRTQPNTQSSV